MERGGVSWYYEYRRLFDLCSEQKLQSVASIATSSFSDLAKDWSVERNSDWTCRMYFATKLILNATVLVNSIRFARRKGLKAAIPYFEYYALLSLLRCVVLTAPLAQWTLNGLISISHAKAINLGADLLSNFGAESGENLKVVAKKLKAQRELISYRVPASGDYNVDQDHDLLEWLMVLAEIAQFNSELLERAVTKHASDEMFVVLDQDIDSIATIELEGYKFLDRDDHYRLSYVKRKTCRPYNLALFMHKGQTEDFFAAWDLDDEGEDTFSNGPPSNWQSIFDIP